jgi:acyl-coenzyme A thioesterase PaaI-like protein
MMMLDITLGVTVSEVVGYDGICPTVQFNCNLVSAAKIGDEIEGLAHISQVTRSLAFATGTLMVGDRTAATASAVFKIPSAVHQPAGQTQQATAAR